MEIWKDRVFKLRMQMGLSQDQFSEKVGSSRISIINWELGKRAPTPIFQWRLAKLEEEMGITPAK